MTSSRSATTPTTTSPEDIVGTHVGTLPNERSSGKAERGEFVLDRLVGARGFNPAGTNCRIVVPEDVRNALAA